MKQKIALTIFLIILAFSLSFTALACTVNAAPPFGVIQDVDRSQQLAFSVPLVIGAGLSGNATPLNQPTRLEIYIFIKNNPGVHFRGICSSLDLSIGVVQYHLNLLVHVGLLSVHDDGQNKRYFEANNYTSLDVNIISLLRHETTKKILTTLIQNGDSLSHKELTKSLLISSQALSWQMNQLKKTGLITAEKDGLTVKYALTEFVANEIRPLLDIINKSVR